MSSNINNTAAQHQWCMVHSNSHTRYSPLTLFKPSGSSEIYEGDNSLQPSVTILKNDKAKYKAPLGKYLHIHFLYSVDEYFKCKDDLRYRFCKIFVVIYIVNLYTCVFMTCSTSCCLYDTLTDPWNAYMYIRMYVYMYVCMYVCKYVQGCADKSLA